MLPKTTLPIYSFTIPSTGKTLNYRPFIQKDKKLLLMALETKSFKDIVTAVKQLLTNCVLEKKFDVDSLASFDIEMFFLTLRARSDSEIMEARFKCENVVDEKRCGNTLEIKENLLELKLTETPGHAKKIALSENTGVMMKYPTFSLLERMQEQKTGVALGYDFIMECIDFIYDKDSVYNTTDISRKELEDFLDGLEVKQFQKIEAFFETMPVLKKEIHKTCEKCGFHHIIPMEGLQSFFD